MTGNILKTAFTGIVGTLCAVLMLLTVMVIWKNFPIETYKGILEVLGIPTLFGMIVQSFIHQKPEDVINEKSQVIQSTSTTVVKPANDSESGRTIDSSGTNISTPSN